LVSDWIYSPSLIVSAAIGYLYFVIFGHLQHEGCHGALSKKAWVNYLGRLTIFPTVSPRQWFLHHAVMHHVHVNTKMDPDYQHGEWPLASLLRHHPKAAYHYLPHRIQQVLALVAGPFVSFPYGSDEAIVQSVFPLVTGKFDQLPYEWWLDVSALLFKPIVIALHYHYHGSLVMAVVPWLAFGQIFVLITQLSHIQEACTTVGEEGGVPAHAPVGEFVSHQAKGGFDYSYSSRSSGFSKLQDMVSTLLSIWLNFQTFHHMYPTVSHLWWFDTRAQDAVVEFLKKEGIQHNYGEAGLWGMIKLHFEFLGKLSQPEKVVQEEKGLTRVGSDTSIPDKLKAA
jgi:fatty acid desaturase